MAGKVLRFFDKDEEIFRWLQQQKRPEAWMYMPSKTSGIPTIIHFFDLELASMCILSWTDRRANRKYDEQGRQAGYSNEE